MDVIEAVSIKEATIVELPRWPVSKLTVIQNLNIAYSLRKKQLRLKDADFSTRKYKEIGKRKGRERNGRGQKRRGKAMTEKKFSTLKISTSYPRYRHLNQYIYAALTSI